MGAGSLSAPRRAALLLAASLCASASGATAQAEQPAPSLSRVRERLQALVQLPANQLAPFRPTIRAGPDPWNTPRAVPLVEVTSPWGAGEALWIQVPEHAWIERAGDNAATLLFSGRPGEIAAAHGWSVPHRPLAPPGWRSRAEGGLELDAELEGGLVVHFRVLPGERLFEIRFGLTNGTATTIDSAWAQLCSGFEKMGPLSDQEPQTVRVWSAGRLTGWHESGDVEWIEAQRDPLSCRIEKSCFFRAFVGEVQEPPDSPAPNVMRLDRPLDLALVVKSDLDRRRHVVLYGPNAREVLFNAVTPCAHADPAFADLAPGETRWGVLYGLFVEGELEPWVATLVEADRALATRTGFRE